MGERLRRGARQSSLHENTGGGRWRRVPYVGRVHRQWQGPSGRQIDSIDAAVSEGISRHFFTFNAERIALRARKVKVTAAQMAERWSFHRAQTGCLRRLRRVWIGRHEDAPSTNTWCTWAAGSSLQLESKYFQGICTPPSHPCIRMWNFFLACAAPQPFRAHPGPALRAGRAWWEKRERVRLGKVARPAHLPWAPQPKVLTYDQQCVVYLLAPKCPQGRAYVGITAVGSWKRMTTRISEAWHRDGTCKRIPADSRRGLVDHLQRVGQRSLLYDYYVIPLEHVPMNSEEMATADKHKRAEMWKSRVGKGWERWWVEYLNTALGNKGWNVEHTRAMRAHGARRADVETGLARRRTRCAHRPMKWARDSGHQKCAGDPTPPQAKAPQRLPRPGRRARQRSRQREFRRREGGPTMRAMTIASQAGKLREWCTGVSIHKIRRVLYALQDRRRIDSISPELEDMWRAARDIVRGHYRSGPPRDMRPLLVGGYVGQAVERLRLPQLVASRAVDSLLPPAVRRILGRPLVCYKYHTPLQQLVCNWGAASRSLGKSEARCICHRYPRFCHAQTGHVITKDEMILQSEELRALFRCGPNFRMRPVDAWQPDESFLAKRRGWAPGAVRVAYMVQEALDVFEKRCSDELDIDRGQLAGWSTAIMEEVDARARSITDEEAEEVMRWSPTEVGWTEETANEVKHLQSHFVIAPADKETGALTITCRVHWEQRLCQEVDSTATYQWAGDGAQRFTMADEDKLGVAEIGRRIQAQSGLPAPLPPLVLPPTRMSPLEVDVTVRVLRASHAFGVLGLPVLTADRGSIPSDRQVEEAYEDVLWALEVRRDRVDDMQWQRAHKRIVEAWWELRRMPSRRQRWMRLHDSGRPITTSLRCPVDVASLEGWATSAEGQQMVLFSDGSPSGKTGAQWVRSLLTSVVTTGVLAGDGYIDIEYQHSTTGADLHAAGFVTSSREYAIGMDPFKLPKAVRQIALARFGMDFDDSASYPRAGAALLQTGKTLANHLLRHRKPILGALGTYFFPSLAAKMAYDRVKRLFNALDMDGTYGQWYEEFKGDIPAGHTLAHTAHLRVIGEAGDDVGTFDLPTYVAQQPQRTMEMADRMPQMLAMMQRIKRARGSDKMAERTLKSYVFQDMEGGARAAKAQWAAARGGQVINLQHDGVIITPPAGMGIADIEQELTSMCTAILGYEQPVEVKQWDQPWSCATTVPQPPRSNPQLAYIDILRMQCQYAQDHNMLVRKCIGPLVGATHPPPPDDAEMDGVEKALDTYKLPYLYGTIKTHKFPYGWRFIAGGMSVALNLVSDWVHVALSAMLGDIDDMAREVLMGQVAGDPQPCESSFIIRGSSDAVRRILDLERRRRAQMQRFRTTRAKGDKPVSWRKVPFGVHDFTTLYPSLPHHLIKGSIAQVLSEVFAMHTTTNGAPMWVGVQKKRKAHAWKAGTTARGQSIPPSNQGTWRYFDMAEIMAHISFILDNTYVTVGDRIYKQVLGVPMGLSCSPMLAVVMLAHYEIAQLRRMREAAMAPLGSPLLTPKGQVAVTYSTRAAHLDLAARFSRCCRAIDDVLLINLTPVEQDWILAETYPPELELKKVCQTPEPIQYLDMEIGHDRGGFFVMLYDKRDELRKAGMMGAVRRFPHPASALSNQCKYSCLSAFLHRVHRVSTRRKHFIRAAVDRVIDMVVDGYELKGLLARVKRFVDTYIRQEQSRAYVGHTIRREVTLKLVAKGVVSLPATAPPASPSAPPTPTHTPLALTSPETRGMDAPRHQRRRPRPVAPPAPLSLPPPPQPLPPPLSTPVEPLPPPSPTERPSTPLLPPPPPPTPPGAPPDCFCWDSTSMVYVVDFEMLCTWLADTRQLVQVTRHAAVTEVGQLWSEATDSIKPAGVWYAMGDEWLQFCEAEMPDFLVRNPYVYVLDVRQDRIRCLTDVEDTRRFSMEYSTDGVDLVNWKRAASAYDGLMVSEYHTDSECREWVWYSSWDVASGVVWDKSKIRGWRRVAERLPDGRYLVHVPVGSTSRMDAAVRAVMGSGIPTSPGASSPIQVGAQVEQPSPLAPSLLRPSTPVPEPRRAAPATTVESASTLSPVLGDGSCWAYAILEALGAMEHAQHPTMADKECVLRLRAHIVEALLHDEVGERLRNTWMVDLDSPAHRQAVEAFRDLSTWRSPFGSVLLDAAAQLLGVDIYSRWPDGTGQTYCGRHRFELQENGRSSLRRLTEAQVVARLQWPTDTPLVVIEYNGVDHFAARVPLADQSFTAPVWLRAQ